MSARETIQRYREAFAEAGILQEDRAGGLLDRPVENVSFDSREAGEGTLFFCKGAHFERAFLASAMEAGALCYVAEEALAAPEEDWPYLLVTDIRKAMALAGNLFYEEAWKRLFLLGITGTKGKSTTAYFMKNILDAKMRGEGHPETAILSSVENYDGVIREESRLTTQEALVLHRHFHHAVRSGISHLTMEVSSHALKYHRTLGVLFDVGAFLNMGEDHISPAEHSSLEDYVNAKMMLFAQSKAAVINLDQTHAVRALEEAEKSPVVQRIFTFSLKEEAPEDLPVLSKPHAHMRAYELQAVKQGMNFRVTGAGEDEAYRIAMPGAFNVSNALAAITMAKVLNVSAEYIREGLLATHVDGRMEVFTDKAERKIVFVDYAHNAMSFNALFDAVEQDYPGRPVYAVFSSAGGKALGRRKELGEIAGRRADLCILTEEDPGEEKVRDINEEIAGYIRGVGGSFEFIDDREEAIRRAIFDSEEDAVILALAKGRESRQKRAGGYEEVETDVSMVERFLEEYDRR